MTDKLKHSPLPWLDIEADEYAGASWIEITVPQTNPHLTNQSPVSITAKKGDKAFIIRAVNSHYKLIEALELSRAALMAVADAAVESGFHQLGDVIDTHLGVVNRVIDEARGE